MLNLRSRVDGGSYSSPHGEVFSAPSRASLSQLYQYRASRYRCQAQADIANWHCPGQILRCASLPLAARLSSRRVRRHPLDPPLKTTSRWRPARPLYTRRTGRVTRASIAFLWQDQSGHPLVGAATAGVDGKPFDRRQIRPRPIPPRSKACLRVFCVSLWPPAHPLRGGT